MAAYAEVPAKRRVRKEPEGSAAEAGSEGGKSKPNPMYIGGDKTDTLGSSGGYAFPRDDSGRGDAVHLVLEGQRVRAKTFSPGVDPGSEYQIPRHSNSISDTSGSGRFGASPTHSRASTETSGSGVGVAAAAAAARDKHRQLKVAEANEPRLRTVSGGSTSSTDTDGGGPEGGRARRRRRSPLRKATDTAGTAANGPGSTSTAPRSGTVAAMLAKFLPQADQDFYDEDASGSDEAEDEDELQELGSEEEVSVEVVGEVVQEAAAGGALSDVFPPLPKRASRAHMEDVVLFAGPHESKKPPSPPLPLPPRSEATLDEGAADAGAVVEGTPGKPYLDTLIVPAPPSAGGAGGGSSSAPVRKVPINLPALLGLSLPCFMGYMSRNEAMQLLANTPPGTYLLRSSRSRPGAVVLTVKSAKPRIDHHVITVAEDDRIVPAGSLLLGGRALKRVYTTMEALLQHLSLNLDHTHTLLTHSLRQRLATVVGGRGKGDGRPRRTSESEDAGGDLPARRPRRISNSSDKGAKQPLLPEVREGSWFHGFISRSTAESLLLDTGAELGSFLVRQSRKQTDATCILSMVVMGLDGRKKFIHHVVVINPSTGETTLASRPLAAKCFSVVDVIDELLASRGPIPNMQLVKPVVYKA